MKNILNKGFTLIELIVVITITAILSGIILFSVNMYISKGKDSSIYGYMTTLIPSGEAFYNANGSSYQGFCASSIVTNAAPQMPQNPVGDCLGGSISGVCCHVESTYYQAWAACVREFANSSNAFCVDSRGIKKDISNTLCTNNLNQCP